MAAAPITVTACIEPYSAVAEAIVDNVAIGSEKGYIDIPRWPNWWETQPIQCITLRLMAIISNGPSHKIIGTFQFIKNSNDWDYWQDEFNYAFYSTGSNFISTPWELNSNWNSPNDVPSTLIFRFKTEGLPKTNIPYSQSLWSLDPSPSNIVLTYTGSGYASSSYSGSIIDPYYQYATLTFYPDSVNYPNSTASIYLPFFDGGWWSVMVTRNNNDFTLSSGNKIYEGGDNNTILGFYSTSSINEDPSLTWLDTSNNSVFFRSSTILSNTYDNFSGSLQEIRYYTNPISESVFKDYIMNPSSIEGNSLNSSPNELAFRVPLGGELYTGSISIHPKITGSWVTTSSFISDSNLYFNSTPTFISNKEYFFYDQPIAGIKNTISDKIRIENNVIPEGDTLSPFMSLSQIVANEKIIEETTGTLGALTDGFSAGLKKVGFGALEAKLGLGEALQSTKDMVAAGEGNVSKMQAAGHLAKQLGQNLTKALGPIGLIAMAVEQIVEAFQKIDGAAGDTAKELGISYQSSRALVGEMNSVAMASNDIMVNTENLVKAQTSLNSLMGTSVQFSGQMAEEFSSIQQRLKLSDGAMASFTKLSFYKTNSLTLLELTLWHILDMLVLMCFQTPNLKNPHLLLVRSLNSILKFELSLQVIVMVCR